MKNVIKLIISLLLPQLAGGIGAIFTTPNISTWYANVNKPSFNPPNYLFGPVWTTLFLMMGISLYLIWTTKESNNKKALTFFFLQLVLNTLWSILFFGLQNPLLAFLEIIILWVFILLTILNFYRLNKTAGLLLIPYILWVSFAGVLNFAIWQLNK